MHDNQPWWESKIRAFTELDQWCQLKPVNN